MVSLAEAIESNKRISTTLPGGLVAVFVGGTSGVGEYTVKAFAKYARSPRVYIVGRSQEAAERVIKECQQLNGDGNFQFIQADVSLLKTVDIVCRQIQDKETAINLLFQSQGSMAFKAITGEGLPYAFALAVHGRLRFVRNLLPLLQNAKSLRRIVHVGAASFEGAIDIGNITGLGFPLHQWRNQMSSITTLLLQEAALQAPNVSFIHNVPGIVKSSIMRDLEPDLKMRIMLAVVRVLSPFIETSPAECAERQLHLASSAKYSPGLVGSDTIGVPLIGNSVVARGCDGKVGSGIYSVDTKGESSSHKVECLIAEFKDNGTAKKVWQYIESDFLEITGTEVIPGPRL